MDSSHPSVLRSILAIVVGYLCMFILVFVSFTVSYLAMGTDRAFQPNSFEVSTTWVATSIVLGLIAAIVGGIICAKIGRHQLPVRLLAALVLVLGLLFAIPPLTADRAAIPARDSALSNFEAMGQAIQPVWVAILMPVVGAIGVLIGGGVLAGRRSGV